MKRIAPVPVLATVLVLSSLVASGCGDSASSGVAPTEPLPDAVPPIEAPTDPNPEPEEGCTESFDGTFAAIQSKIFEGHGCTAEACHGNAASGGLDLRAETSYENLVEARSVGSELSRIAPGDNDRSYLWLKLAAKTAPGTVSVGGSPMPIGETTLSEDELELLRRWIKGGAPEQGSVLEAESLIDACLPEAEPVIIAPLTPPEAGVGLQVVMPEYDLPAGREREVCFAQAYDLRDQIPAEFLNEAGDRFRISASELRQDPQSHHLLLIVQDGDGDPSEYGDFFCKGGERAGEPCEALDFGACGEGLCASTAVDAVGCVGFPSPDPGAFLGGESVLSMERVLVVQQAQESQVLTDGVFAEIPTHGIWIWNSHAFNLTTSGAAMHARVNFTFATEAVYPVERILDISAIFTQNTPPFARETLCNDFEFPRGARLFNLLSHTHKRGERFWIEAPSGEQIYENFVYNDPVNQYYDPPLAFDSPDPEERTVHYCATFNNGVLPDGSPDPSVVKRASVVPQNALTGCDPVACTAGRVGEACEGVDDDGACDSSPGAGDGECDACVLHGGVSTEDEMFLILGAFYVED